MNKKINPVLKSKAVTLYAYTPNITHKEVAEKLEISDKTLMKLRKSPDFWDDVYQEYMIELESEIPSVLRATLREAKSGNIMASKLLLEHTGKLQNNINIVIDSPWQQYLRKKGDKLIDVDEAEIVVDELPDRTADNSHEAIEEQFTAMDRELRKKEHYLKKRREQYSWSRRAELVGVPPLPPRRPKKSERLEWEMEIIRKEEEYK